MSFKSYLLEKNVGKKLIFFQGCFYLIDHLSNETLNLGIKLVTIIQPIASNLPEVGEKGSHI